ncbi:alternative ribosome rescue factor ArfA [Salinicola rhizosphaerae]|uniref:Ribosome alternative rescue factor ArfA n=1 Tax=Salinicola rhizosphaerae TaxID=1443141 RepID=A0ABQ3DQ87_9GAMM|nr:alternative ribosome rescue factor ArfA [Salinicola rhizosphaerae]GHB11782.1 hypothetical protein GCM10009038_06670 [Salinicola rhizosphaerae]
MSPHPIRDNALKAALRSPQFRQQQQKPRKGKGSYTRKGRAPQGGRHCQAA